MTRHRVDPKSLRQLVEDLPRGQNEHHIGQLPANYFADPADIIATESLRYDVVENAASKLFMGVVGGRVVTGDRMADGRVPRWVEGGVPLGIGSDQSHLLLAGSRGGKGISMLLNSIIGLPANTSFFALDPKGQNARISAGFRSSIQEVKLLDSFNASGIESKANRLVINPIEEMTGATIDQIAANAMLVADSLVEEEASGNHKHWEETAKEMIAALCAHVATDSNYEGRRDLVTVWELASRLSEPDPNDPHAFEIEMEMLRNDSAAGFVRSGARAFYSRTSDEFSSVASSVRRYVSFVGIEAVRKNLRGPRTELRRLKSSSLGFYYCMPAMYDHALRGFKRLVMQSCLGACEAEPTQFGPQTVFFLDEFHSLGRMTVMETAIAQFAGIGVKLVIVLQDLSQLQKLYPKSFETFIGNCGSIQAFSLNDYTTLSYLSKRLGQTVAVSHSVNRPGRDQVIGDGASGVSFALTNTPLMTPNEIELFFARDDSQLRQLMLRPGYRPMILQRHFVYESPYFSSKMNWEMQS